MPHFNKNVVSIYLHQIGIHLYKYIHTPMAKNAIEVGNLLELNAVQGQDQCTYIIIINI